MVFLGYMQYIDRKATVHRTFFANRPRIAGVLHDTESLNDLTVDKSAGGWNWLVGREAVIYRDIDERYAAWHVEATGHTPGSILETRWRPNWLLPCPGGLVSDINYCTIGIEIVSHQQYRDAGVPYTDQQYLALAILLADIQSRYGRIPWVGHGQLQTNRTDPVGFDWGKAGFGSFHAGIGYFWDGLAPTPLPPQPLPPEGITMLNDEEALAQVVTPLWAPISTTDASGGYTAIAKSWVRELRAGRYRGAPISGEMGLAGGGVWQRFTDGVAVWKGGADPDNLDVSWKL
jgi:hypothetical protein